MEAVGNDPTQAYLCAGVLQTLELSIAQRLHKSFSMLWSGWGISKSQPLASKASRLPLTIHPDIWYPEMVTLHRQTIISRPFFY